LNKRLFLFCLIFPLSIYGQNVVINEVMSSNKLTILDSYGTASDWIELYNSSGNVIDLSGWYVSDDSTRIKKWRFGPTQIQPGGYLLIFASDKDTQHTEIHTNFKISATGENIVLSDSNGIIVDFISLPELTTDISFGRITDGNSVWIKQYPSPGTENTGSQFSGVADPVELSLSAGFYPSEISVTLSAGDSKIYYTTDGSDPDSTDTEYTDPINISETTVLKTISYKKDCIPSKIKVNTYFINETTDLPVISLTSDPYNLFDYNYGIYTDGPGWTAPDPHVGANYWMDWERPAHVEFFDDNNTLGFSEDCGIAIYGAWSRAHPQKSFSVKFKSDYGVNKIDYQLFPDLDLSTFKSFVLRNSGNDFYYVHFRDAMMQTLIQDLDIDYLEYRPTASFVNGEYWGIYNIREKINEHYIANRHGVDPDNIDMLEANKEVVHGDTVHYQQILDYISTNDMTTEEAYNFLDSRIDLKECILYFAAQSYYNNRDWPANNIKFWREKTETGKWRWILYDLDFGFNLYEFNGQALDDIAYIFSTTQTGTTNPQWATLLQRKLIENPKIRNMFINQVADLLNTNFKGSRVVEIIDEMKSHIANEISRHRTRWSISGENTDRMIKFANERPDYLRGFVRNYFNCGSNGNIIVNATKGGQIQLNTLKLNTDDFPWTGTYFQGNAIHLKAVPAPGYKFDGWTGAVNSTDSEIPLNVTANSSITASFSVDSNNTKGVVITEINYNSADEFNSGDWVEIYNRTTESIDISGWIYSDSDDEHRFEIPQGTILPSQGFLVIVEDSSLFSTQFPDVTNFIGETGFSLSGSGEYMKLMDSVGVIVDSLTYDDQEPWPLAADGLGSSLELKDPLIDNSIGSNWLASVSHGTPGKVNSSYVSVDEQELSILPSDFTLSQNYPNPFNPVTTIKYAIPTPPASSPLVKGRIEVGFVTLKVYNLLGQEIATLVNEVKPAGNYEVKFDAGNLASGVYLYRLQAGEFSAVKKLILMK